MKFWRVCLTCLFRTYISSVNTYRTLSSLMNSSFTICKSTEPLWWQKSVRWSIKCKLKSTTNIRNTLRILMSTWKSSIVISAKELSSRKICCTHVCWEIGLRLILMWLTFLETQVKLSKHIKNTVMILLTQRVKLLTGLFVTWWREIKNIIKVNVFTKLLHKFQKMERLEVSFFHWHININVQLKTY